MSTSDNPGAKFPSELDSTDWFNKHPLTNKSLTESGDVVNAAYINQLRNIVARIETWLGAKPIGAVKKYWAATEETPNSANYTFVGGMLNHPPVGTVIAWAGTTTTNVPDGWLPCDGRQVTKAEYPELVEVLTGNTSTTIAYTPNLTDRVVRGVASTGGWTSNNANSGGADSVRLSGDHLPAHKHSINATEDGVNTLTNWPHSHTVGKAHGGSGPYDGHLWFRQAGSPSETIWSGSQAFMGTENSILTTITANARTGSNIMSGAQQDVSTTPSHRKMIHLIWTGRVEAQ